MVDYTALKVAELKDLLKQRGLGVSGTKAELVSRLEENDSNENKVEKPTEKEETAEETATKGKSTNDSKSNDNITAKEPPVDESVGQDDVTKTTAVIEELKKRIKRNERFGADDQNEDLKRQIARIEKFGLDNKQANKVLQPKLGDKNKIQKKSSKNNGVPIDEETARKRKERFGS